MLYRVLVNLDRWQAGEITPLESVGPAALDRLIAADCIVPLSSPPLDVIDGWDIRAKRLAKLGVIDAMQFLEADTTVLARKLRVKTKEIESWKSELLGWLTMPQGA